MTGAAGTRGAAREAAGFFEGTSLGVPAFFETGFTEAMGCAGGLIDEALGEIAVGVYPPVTEEGPMGAGDVHLGEVNLYEHNLLLLD